MPTIVVGKKKQASGTGSGDDRGSARTQARMRGNPPGASTAAKYENLVADETNYSIDGEYRQPLPSPEYRKEEWSYVDTHVNEVWTSTATCWFIKITHERTNLPPAAGLMLPAGAMGVAKKATAKKAAKKSATKKAAGKAGPAKKKPAKPKSGQ